MSKSLQAPGAKQPFVNVFPAPVLASRDPATTDISAGVATWVNATVAGAVTQLDGDSGSATPVTGVVDIVGDTDLVTSATGNTVTVAIDAPFDVANGGTGATSLTDNAVLVGSGTGAVTALTVGTDGQVLLGSTAADPVFADLASADGTVAFTAGAGTLDLSVDTAVSQPLLFREVTLTSTEVKALATTPIELVAAPAAGSVVQFQGATLKLNYGGTNAFTESGDNLGIKYTDASGVQVCTAIECTGFIDQTADTYTNAVPSADAIVAATGAEAQALVLDNLGSNFAGNAADDNTLTVRCYYTVQALA